MLSEIRQTPYDFTFVWNVKTKQMLGNHIVRFATQKGNPKVMKLGAHIGAAADTFAPPLHQGERERRDREREGERGKEREREGEKKRDHLQTDPKVLYRKEETVSTSPPWMVNK